jgi:transposase
MSYKGHILNLPHLSIKSSSGFSPIVLDVICSQILRCIYCHNQRLRKKDSFMRTLRHEAIGMKPSLLKIKIYKLYCASCQRYFNQRIPGVRPYQRATERLKEQVFIQHSQGICQKTLSDLFKLGKATIERWYHQYYQRKNLELSSRECPKVLGIDEHFFNKRLGFATTLCDLRRHKVFDVVPGRSRSELHAYLPQLQGRDKVQVVCMDLSSNYKNIVKLYFPNAKIVADRFHVIRLINHMALHTYQTLDKDIKYHRSRLGLLRTKPENLSSKKKLQKEEYLKTNPAVAAIDAFKQRLHRLLMIKHQTQRQCKMLLPLFLKMLHELKQSPFKPLQTLGKTLYQWREEIVRIWRFTKSNGITEGFHRKMKLIQRRAYGFRCFENYRLRVRVLCS